MVAIDTIGPGPTPGMALVTTYPCVMCGKPSQFVLEANKIMAVMEGEFVQNAFPFMPADQRETLISGTHGECFDKLFLPGE